MKKNAFTVDDVSKICGVTIQTVAGWVKQDIIPAYKTPGGNSLIKRNDLIEFLKQNRIPFPKELAKEGSCRIFIINESKTVVALLSRLIKKTYDQFIIGSINDGIRAGRKILSFKPDLVLIGLKFSEADGFEICKKIKFNPETKHQRILLITGFNPEKIENKILGCGADGFISKPFNIIQISSYLNEFKINFDI